jgi:hypothetical protein
MAKALGVPDFVTSPSFIYLINIKVQNIHYINLDLFSPEK